MSRDLSPIDWRADPPPEADVSDFVYTSYDTDTEVFGITFVNMPYISFEDVTGTPYQARETFSGTLSFTATQNTGVSIYFDIAHFQDGTAEPRLTWREESFGNYVEGADALSVASERANSSTQIMISVTLLVAPFDGSDPHVGLNLSVFNRLPVLGLAFDTSTQTAHPSPTASSTTVFIRSILLSMWDTSSRYFTQYGELDYDDTILLGWAPYDSEFSYTQSPRIELYSNTDAYAPEGVSFAETQEIGTVRVRSSDNSVETLTLDYKRPIPQKGVTQQVITQREVTVSENPTEKAFVDYSLFTFEDGKLIRKDTIYVP